MDSEARLLRALAAPVAPRRDPSFTLAVIADAEQARFRRQAALAVLRSGGLVSAAAALAVPLSGWVGANPGVAQSAGLAGVGLLALMWAGHLAARRADSVLGR